MMYLIGGAPRLGKSIIAEHMGIPHISTDALCSKDTDMQFSKVMHLGTAQIVEMQLNKAQTMTKSLEQFIEHQLGTHSDFILEGVHLLPPLISNLYHRHTADVRGIIIVATDKEIALQGLRADLREQNWMKGASDQMHNAMADFVVGYSKELLRQNDSENIVVFERTENLQQDVDTIVNYLRLESD